jgi:hypothetical protein
LIDWSTIELKSDVNKACDMFYSKIYELLLDKYVPKFKRSRHRFPSWYTPEIKNTIKLKGVARKRYLKSRDKKDYDELIMIAS